jgi:hypothetical protein
MPRRPDPRNFDLILGLAQNTLADGAKLSAVSVKRRCC